MATLVKHPTLYQVDSKGKVRTWWMETEGGKHRAVAGVEGGKEVVSGWKECKPKNVGRANATTPEQQALLEVESLYTKKLEKKYYRDREEAAGGNKFFAPMLALKWEDRKSKINLMDTVWTQPKLDGMRCVVTKDGMNSRNGKPIISAPHILEQLQEFFSINPNQILDGELYSHKLKDNFDRVMELCRKSKPTPIDLAESEEMVEYHIYDIPGLGDLPFSTRWGTLQKLHESYFQRQKSIKLVETVRVKTQIELDSVYAGWLEEGYEGQMIRTDVPYHPGPSRSDALIKRKEFMEDEFAVKAIEEGQGNWAGAAKRAICYLPDGRDFEAGMRGTYEKNAEVLKKVQSGWLPKEVTVRFQNYTPDGIPRFGVVVNIWENGRARDE